MLYFIMRVHLSFYAAVMVAALAATVVVAMLAFMAIIPGLVGAVIAIDLLILGWLASIGAGRADDWLQHDSYEHALGHTVGR